MSEDNEALVRFYALVQENPEPWIGHINFAELERRVKEAREPIRDR